MGKRPNRWRALKEVVVFVEGGGPGRSRRDIRAGLHNGLFKDLRTAAAKRGVELRFIPSGGRDDTIDDYLIAIRHESYESVLLVDSEGPVLGEPLEHLRNQGCASELTTGSKIHLMVQAIEAWFLADPEALKRHFRTTAQVKELESIADVESVAKDRLKAIVDKVATSAGGRGYDEADHQGPLLRTVSPAALRSKSPHFDRLWRGLEQLVGL